jgi:hypothetical protein
MLTTYSYNNSLLNGTIGEVNVEDILYHQTFKTCGVLKYRTSNASVEIQTHYLPIANKAGKHLNHSQK